MDKKKCYKSLCCLILFLLILVPYARAADLETMTKHSMSATFFWIAIVLMFAKFSSLVERIGQVSVLGELVIGVVLGNLVLLNINFFEPIKSNPTIAFLAELGIVVLLFQIGLASNIKEMLKVGWRAFWVAVVGIVAPFVLGAYVVGPLFLPGLPTATYLFLGAILTTTSVGITASIFRDLDKLHELEAQIVLGAAVIDDVLGLIILSAASAIVTSGSFHYSIIGLTALKAVVFLIGAVALGQLLAAKIGKLLSLIQTGTGMKFTLAICFALFFSFFADLIGLDPIVGAFAAGLILDPVHFRYFKDPKIVIDVKKAVHGSGARTKERVLNAIRPHARRHVEDIIEPIGIFLTPIFFVIAGMAVKLETLFNPHILLLALGIAAAAFLGKLIAGTVAGNVRKAVVGWGMVPRGEVGLIFATVGKNLNVISDEVFSVVIVVFILSAFITPPILTYLLKKRQYAGAKTT